MNIYKILPLVGVLILGVQGYLLSQEAADMMEGDNSGEIFDLSIEELMELPVEVSGSLTGSTRRLNPSTVTTITQDDIRRSGARDLDELLDIYVPSYQRMHDYYEFRKSGLRGINSDRDDKYLILVNGKVMNEHSHYGAISERDLPMLKDIHHVDVIRGPGSALYGPGAIAMVINIITENAMTFEGAEVTARAGYIEEFYSGEIKYGKKLSDESGILLFAGVTKYLGADDGDTPIEYGRPEWANWDTRQPRLHQSWRDMPKYKLHAEFTHGDFDAWVRWTRGGEFRSKLDWFPDDWQKQGDGYQQFTVATKYTQEVSDTLELDYSLSYDLFDYEKAVFDVIYSHREDEYQGRLMARWDPNEDHSVAIGGEYTHEKFGIDSPRYPGDPAQFWTFDIYGIEMRTWKDRMYSILGEYRWNMLEDWTVFVGGRMDNHSLTDNMYSPRGTLVYTPTEIDTAKLIYARSVRTGQVEDLKATDVMWDRETKPEKIDAFELRYERQQTEHLWLAASGFYNYHDLTGYDFNVGYTTNLGNLETWGLEGEAMYGTENTKVIFSHAYTKLIDWDPEPGQSDVISAEPYGYGEDLANWSNHITKLSLHQALTDALSTDCSVRAYWGYPGFKDYARWTEDYWESQGFYVPRAKGSQFRPTFFVNWGFQYDFSKDLYIRLDGHDLLGFIDDDNNKRLFGYYMEGDTRSTAPSLSFSVSYRF